MTATNGHITRTFYFVTTLNLYAIAMLSGILILFVVPANGAVPLITDDAGTIGKGTVQAEVLGYQDTYKTGHGDTKETEKTHGTEVTLTYGLTENIDLAVMVPYGRIVENYEGYSMSYTGFGDAYVSLKWNVFKNDDFAISLKPFVWFPSGNAGRGFGNGWVSYELYFIVTKEFGPVAVHLNLGYTKDGRTDEEEAHKRDMWNVYGAAEWKITDLWKVFVDAGIARTFKNLPNRPPYIMGGFFYSLSEKTDIGVGYLANIGGAEQSRESVRLGLTIKF